MGWVVFKWGTGLWLGVVLWLAAVPLWWCVFAEVFALVLTAVAWLAWHERHHRFHLLWIADPFVLDPRPRRAAGRVEDAD